MSQPETSSNFSEQSLSDIIYKIFGLRNPNAFGESAFKLDNKGLYTKAINRPEYYLHAANKNLFTTRSAKVARHMKGVRHAVIFGQGPGEVFDEQEALLLAQMPDIEEITTIEFSDIFNNEAGAVVERIAAKLGHRIKHNKLTHSFEAAARLYPELLLSAEQKLIICSGSTLMNLEETDRGTIITGEFPHRALKEKLNLMRSMAGHRGFVLVTYDAYKPDKIEGKLAAYRTPEAQNLFMNVIDVLAAKRSETAHLSRSDFEHVVRWNPKSYDAEQVLRVVKPLKTVMQNSDDNGNVRIQAFELPGDEFWIINSFMPPVEMVINDAQEVYLDTVFAIDDPSSRKTAGFTMHLMQSVPAQP